MKTLIFLLALVIMPGVASAQLATSSDGGALEELLRNILVFSNEVLIPFIIGLGFLVFVWGMFQYFIAGGANEESREKGRKLMINATLGFVVIIIFFGVINMLTSSTGLTGTTLQNIPEVPIPSY